MKKAEIKNVKPLLQQHNVSRRFFRIVRIRLHGKYRLLKSVDKKIVIFFLTESIKKYTVINSRVGFTPSEFNDVMNKAQLNYLNSLSQNGG